MDPELLTRFEAVVARLESIADLFSNSTSPNGMPDVVSTAAVALCSPQIAHSHKSITDSISSRYLNTSYATENASVKSFDELLQQELAEFIQCSNKVGGDLLEVLSMILRAFYEERAFLARVSMCKEPPPNITSDLIKYIQTPIEEIQTFHDHHRSSDLFNHLSMISESILALGWVTVAPTPVAYVQEMYDVGTFYANRILKDRKGKDESHCEVVRTWLAVLKRLEGYVKEYHTTGVQWKNSGRDVLLPPCGGPPSVDPFSVGPPPMPPHSHHESIGAIPPANSVVPLNETPIRSNHSPSTLDSVDHTIRPQDSFIRVVAPRGFSKPSPKPKPPSMAGSPISCTSKVTSPASIVKLDKSQPAEVKKVNPPRLELEGKKWIIENYVGDHSLVISNVDMKQTVYVYKCVDCVVTIKGKVNMIMLDGCKKTGVVFDEVISSVDFINCCRVQMQVLNKVPTVSVDKTDGCMIYLSNQSLDTQLITSKSSEMNLLIPDETGSEFIECPVPEQFVSVWNGIRFTTEPQTST